MDEARLTRRALGLAACLLLPWMGAEAASPLPPPVQVGAPMAEVLTEAWLSLTLTAGRAGEREEAKRVASW